jgi:hypothetical protein
MRFASQTAVLALAAAGWLGGTGIAIDRDQQSPPGVPVIDGNLADWPNASAVLQATTTADDILIGIRLPSPAVVADMKELLLTLTPATGPADRLTWVFAEGRLLHTASGRRWAGEEADISVVPPFRTAVAEMHVSRHEVPGLAAEGSLRLDLHASTGAAVTTIASMMVSLPVGNRAITSPTLRLDRPPDTVRIFSLNAETSALMDSRRGEAIARLVRAAAPDVLVFQEMYAPSAEDIAARLQTLLPGPAWQVAKRGLDLVVATRRGRLDAVLLHTFPEFGSIAAFDVWLPGATMPLQLINAHLPCCRPSGVEDRRRLQIDAAMTHARRRRTDFPDAPMLLIGDLNLVGTDTVLADLVRGDGLGPKWLDLVPTRPTRPTTATWRVVGSRFPPSRLDYALISHPPPSGTRAFIFDTRSLPMSWLASHSLERGDSDAASDHQAVIVDVPSPRLDDPIR